MRILHFGDLHVWKLQPAWNDLFYLKRWIGPLNLILRRAKKFPPALGEAIAADILKQDADLVVFSGDMSTNSLPREFERAAAILQPIRDRWGERFVCLPGNHDRYTPRSIRQRLYETHFPYGDLGESKVRTWRVSEEVSVIGFDCSRPWPVRSNGRMDKALAAAVDEALDAEQDRRVILVGHYPFATPPHVEMHWQHGLLEAERLIELVDRHQPALFLHGHKHERWLIRQGKTVCCDCGSAGMRSTDPYKQAGYMLLDCSANLKLQTATARVISQTDDAQVESVEMALPG